MTVRDPAKPVSWEEDEQRNELDVIEYWYAEMEGLSQWQTRFKAG